MFESIEQGSNDSRIDSLRALRLHQYSSLDLQYEICAKYVQHTAERLYQHEHNIIQQSAKLVQKMMDNASLKDISTTQESLTVSGVLQDEDHFMQTSRSRLLLRKTQSNCSIRRSDGGFNEAMREVQKVCSGKTYSVLSNMAHELRKIKERQPGSDKLEKDLKRLEHRLVSTDEEQLLLRKRVSDLEVEAKSREEEIYGLRKRIRELAEEARSSNLHHSRSTDNLRSINVKGDRLKRFLQQKEVHIFKRQRDVRVIEDGIQRSIETMLNPETCDRCCELLKRVRDSIMKYRAFMGESWQLTEKLYEKYKLQLLHED